MTENMQKLLEKISGDEDLKKELNSMDTTEKVIDFAKRQGIDISEEDLSNDEQDGELDLDEADAVAGGNACVCVFGGGAKSDENKDSGCACVGAGSGLNEDGDNRCGCILVGVGNSCTYEGELF